MWVNLKFQRKVGFSAVWTVPCYTDCCLFLAKNHPYDMQSPVFHSSVRSRALSTGRLFPIRSCRLLRLTGFIPEVIQGRAEPLQRFLLNAGERSSPLQHLSIVTLYPTKANSYHSLQRRKPGTVDRLKGLLGHSYSASPSSRCIHKGKLLPFAPA